MCIAALLVRAVTRREQINASHLRPHIEQCGYRRSFILPKVEFGGSAPVALAAFAHPPFDARSVCLVAVDGRSDAQTAAAFRATGAPVVLICDQRQLHWWRLGARDVRPIGRPVDEQDLPGFFDKNSDHFSPQRVYRAKTWARFDRQLQLPFVDVELLPIVERDCGSELKQLIEQEYARLQRLTGWLEPDASQGHWMLQAVFWLLSAKMLADKGVDAFADLDFQDVRSVFRSVAQHHNSPVTRVAQSNLRAATEVAANIADSANLRFATIESLAFVYENALITPEIRDELGTHSTPSYLVDYIVGRLAPWIKQIDVAERNVFEPACGHAGFLVAGMRLLTELLPQDRATASQRRLYLRSRIHGCELDPFALEIARLSLTLADIPNPDGWDLERADMFATDALKVHAARASVLLANPPFANFSSEEKEQYRDAGQACRFRNKTAEMLHRTLPNLPDGGCFGVVVPQGFLHARNTRELRRGVLADFEIDEILLFPDKVFTFSDMESAVLIGRRQRVKKSHRVRYRRVREPEIENFRASYSASSERHVPQCRFQTADCDLRVPELEELWRFISAEPGRLGGVADVGQGFTPMTQKSLSGGQFYFTEKSRGLVPVFHRFPREAQLHELPVAEWADVSESNLDRPRWGAEQGTPQLIFNYVPTSRGPWRIKAMLDLAGHAVSSSFVVVRPLSDALPLEFFWALLNSPIANAYAYSHLGKRHNIVGTMRNLPVPSPSSKDARGIRGLVVRYFEAVEQVSEGLFRDRRPDAPSELLLRIDSAILNLYHLPARVECELLELFSGWRRDGVPFESNQYLPPHFKKPIHLHELLAITLDWERTNRQRCQLIDEEVEGRISEGEAAELETLQRLADLRTDLMDPFELDELELIHSETLAANA